MPIHATYRNLAEDWGDDAEDSSPYLPLQKTDDYANEPDCADD